MGGIFIIPQMNIKIMSCVANPTSAYRSEAQTKSRFLPRQDEQPDETR
jgi:hypothetical protein